MNADMHTATVRAIDAADVTKIGVGVIVGLVVIGVLLGLVITALIGRIIIALVVIGLGIFVWSARSSVENRISDQVCPPNLSFVGLHLDAPQSYKDFCKSHRDKRQRHQVRSGNPVKTR